MSQFTGKQFKGAKAVRRQEKKADAISRNAAANAKMRLCGHVHGQSVECINRAVSA